MRMHSLYEEQLTQKMASCRLQHANDKKHLKKCWAHSLLPADARPFTRCRLRIDVHDDAGQRRRQRQRQRVTEGTAMASWNGPNYTVK